MTTTHPARDCAICRRCSPPLSNARLSMLGRIAELNDAGSYPSKAALTRGVPNRTRMNRYLMLGEMEHAGLIVDNSAPHSAEYHYEATWYGRFILDTPTGKGAHRHA